MGTALITGSSGFVGRHFAARLEREGWKITGVDLAQGRDLRDFLQYPPVYYDLVIHAAAVIGGRAVIESNPLAQAVNLELDAKLFWWARTARPGRIVYFSSSAIYPVSFQKSPARYLLHEDDVNPRLPAEPDSLYGWTKLTGEYLARLSQRDGQAVTVVRPFSGYGPDQDASYPFPAFIDRALAGADPFTIWGSGEQVRDFIHISDIVAAVMTMTEREMNGPVNLGWGRPVSMNELAVMICRVAGHAPVFERIPAAPSGVDYRVADTSRMNAIWRPVITLEAGIREALAYRR